jgi:hypothetical protein
MTNFFLPEFGYGLKSGPEPTQATPPIKKMCGHKINLVKNDNSTEREHPYNTVIVINCDRLARTEELELNFKMKANLKSKPRSMLKGHSLWYEDWPGKNKIQNKYKIYGKKI